MLSIINQTGNTKLDISMYFIEKDRSSNTYGICSVDPGTNNLLWLGIYDKKEQAEKVFEQMICAENEQMFPCFTKGQIYRLPKNE
jgi:hypothetical protein